MEIEDKYSESSWISWAATDANVAILLAELEVELLRESVEEVLLLWLVVVVLWLEELEILLVVA